MSDDDYTRHRDSFRWRVYDAEDAAFGRPENAKRKVVVPKLLDKLLATPEWKEWVPFIPEVRWYSATKRSSPKGGRIYGRPAIRTKRKYALYVVCHELAHVVTSEEDIHARANPRRAWHGPEFVRNYVTLVLWLMGEKDAARLCKALDKQKVPYALEV